MAGILRENSGPVMVSLALHGLLVAGFLLMTRINESSRVPDMHPLPIDAVVVDSSVLHAAQRMEAERAEQAREAAQKQQEAEAEAARKAAEAKQASEEA